MAASQLRNFSPAQIEQALAKGLSELVGSEFVVEISSTKFIASRARELTGAPERVELSLSASPKPEPFSVNINFTNADGTHAGDMVL